MASSHTIGRSGRADWTLMTAAIALPQAKRHQGGDAGYPNDGNDIFIDH